MSKAIRNALSTIERAIGLEAGDHGGDDVELARGHPHDPVPIYWSEEAKGLLRRIFRGRSDEAEKLAGLDGPHLTLRVIAEGDRTVRGRRHLAEFGQVLERHLTQLRATDGACPWREGQPVLIDLAPADYGVSLPVPRRWSA